jgi:hypothetical protein
MQHAEQEAPRADARAAAAAAEEAAAAAEAAEANVVSSSDHEHHPAGAAAASPAAAPAYRTYDSSDDDGPARRPANPIVPDPHYDENQDEEDEAWVYRHMRGGRAEEVAVVASGMRGADAGVDANSLGGTQPSFGDQDGVVSRDENAGQQQQQQQQQQQEPRAQDGGGKARPAPPDMSKVLMLKPRNSDAVLSCPCCFTIVCMDCQRHVRYCNQYRAMFVMNIGVSWHKRLRWDDGAGELVVVDAVGVGTSDGAAAACSTTSTRTSSTDAGNMDLDLDDSGSAVGGDGDVPDAVPGDSCEEGQRPQKNQMRGRAADAKTNETAANASRNCAPREGDGEIYYSVHCVSCHTEVAYLNMEDEVYHFVNCLAASG